MVGKPALAIGFFAPCPPLKSRFGGREFSALRLRPLSSCSGFRPFAIDVAAFGEAGRRLGRPPRVCHLGPKHSKITRIVNATRVRFKINHKKHHLYYSSRSVIGRIIVIIMSSRRCQQQLSEPSLSHRDCLCISVASISFSLAKTMRGAHVHPCCLPGASLLGR